jgi:hypothetical protein
MSIEKRSGPDASGEFVSIWNIQKFATKERAEALGAATATFLLVHLPFLDRNFGQLEFFHDHTAIGVTPEELVANSVRKSKRHWQEELHKGARDAEPRQLFAILGASALSPDDEPESTGLMEFGKLIGNPNSHARALVKIPPVRVPGEDGEEESRRLLGFADLVSPDYLEDPGGAFGPQTIISESVALAPEGSLERRYPEALAETIALVAAQASGRVHATVYSGAEDAVHQGYNFSGLIDRGPYMGDFRVYSSRV